MNPEATTTAPPIASVEVLSTGTGEIHREHRYGTKKPKIWWALFSKSWTKISVNVFVIRHRDGLILFDTGLNPAVVTDENYVNSAIGRFFMRKVFRFDISAEDSLSNKLRQLGHSPLDVKKVVTSHLHFDHVGGIAEVPQAELIVSRDEWSQLDGPHPEQDYMFREHIELPGAKWRQIDFTPVTDPLLSSFYGSYDLMGDGSLILLPTPGHTKGSLSMLIRSASATPILLVGDLTQVAELLLKDQLPGVYMDKSQMKASFARVRELKKQLPNLLILSSHDPEAAKKLNAAFA